MSDMQTVELQQPQSTNEQMTAAQQPTQNQARDNADAEAQQQQQPRLGMRGGGLIYDLCACFICFEACDACCHAIDDCCCC